MSPRRLLRNEKLRVFLATGWWRCVLRVAGLGWLSGLLPAYTPPPRERHRQQFRRCETRSTGLTRKIITPTRHPQPLLNPPRSCALWKYYFRHTRLIDLPLHIEIAMNIIKIQR